MKIRPFEIVLIAVFAIAGLGGLFVLSAIKGEKNAEELVYGNRVEVWGTFPQDEVGLLFHDLAETDKGFSVVKYKRIDERALDGELLNAIAEGTPPDLVIMPHTLIVSYKTKLLLIPQKPEEVSTYRDTYIDGAEIFQTKGGIYGVPLAVDPLVVYWNRDLFSSAGLAQPPKTWERLIEDVVPALTILDENRTPKQSAIGLGEFINVNHAKDILSMLFLQAGTKIVEEGATKYEVTLPETLAGGTPPGASALNFYTQFASPSSKAYTWSRSRQFDRAAFIGGTLGMYIGAGSEIKGIEDENPNLNFDIAPVPQSEGATALRNYGTFYAFVIPKASRNQAGAYRAAVKLSQGDSAKKLLDVMKLAPANRSLFTSDQGGRYGNVLRASTLIARGWLDPSADDSRKIFKEMIEKVTSGRMDAEQAVFDGAYSLGDLFK